MKKIDDKSLERINGGFSAWAAIAIAAGVVYLSGIFNGIVNPKSCEN